MPSVVTAIIAAGRKRTIDYNGSEACDVVIKVIEIRVTKELAIVLLYLFDSGLQ